MIQTVKASNDAQRENKSNQFEKGIHILADMYETTNGREEMLNAEKLKFFCESAVNNSGLTQVGESFVQFPNAGVTGVILLAESHITIHTWPEKDYITLDVFVCNVSSNNTEKARVLYHQMLDLFKPNRIKHQEIERE